jgi:hypothetical protein
VKGRGIDPVGNQKVGQEIITRKGDIKRLPNVSLHKN